MDSPNISPSEPQAIPAASCQEVRFRFDNTYTRLPEHFYARLDPTPVAAPRLVKVNVELARELGLDADALKSEYGVAVLAGNRVAEGAEPVALAYAGHQFGHFVPQLGDGRTNLLGEVLGRDGVRYDVQLKGSGRTPFSRGGDGKALSRGCAGQAAVPGAAGGRSRTTGAADCAMGAARFHPWRDEHRQHIHLGRDDRLRPLRLHGGIRSGNGIQFH